MVAILRLLIIFFFIIVLKNDFNSIFYLSDITHTVLTTKPSATLSCILKSYLAHTLVQSSNTHCNAD
jgi:hypothetical protein